MLLPSTCLMLQPSETPYNGTVSEYYANLISKSLASLSNGDLREESLNPQDISEQDIIRIHQIEQDAWAHGIEEYLICQSCGNVVGKNQTFGKLPSHIQKRTVSRIEGILGKPSSKCIKCNGNMKAIYGSEYIGEIRERYRDSKGFVSLLRDPEGTIQGFIDAYVDDFSTIYRREFKAYYSGTLSEEEMKCHLERSLGRELPDRILFWTSVALSERYRSLSNIYRLLKSFFGSMSGGENYLCISEARVGTNISKIYLKMGAQAGSISDVADLNSINGKASGVQNEIYLQDDIVPTYNKNLEMPPRDFWRFCFR